MLEKKPKRYDAPSLCTYHSSGIDNICSKMNFAETNYLVMHAFNRWVIGFPKVASDKGTSKRRFPNGSQSQDGHLSMNDGRIFHSFLTSTCTIDLEAR